jgi:hypothetical protein
MLVVKVIAGVVVEVATVPAKPFAETTDALVTVPEPLSVHVGTAAPLLVKTCPAVPAAVKFIVVPSPTATAPAVGVLLPLIITVILLSFN